MSAEENAGYGLLFGILSFVVGIIAIIIALVIYKKVQDIRKRQIENAEGTYKEDLKQNAKEIHDHFKNIIIIAKKGEDVEDEEKIGSITDELDLYYSSNHKKMRSLIENTETALRMWSSLESSKREKYKEIIEYFKWLTDEYFPPDANPTMKTRIWKKEYSNLRKKRSKIEEILNIVLSTEA